MKKLFILLFIILSGLITIPSNLNPLSENHGAWYDMHTGEIHCYDKWSCLHESVHKYDWENGNGQISATKGFHKAVTEFDIKVSEIPLENRTFIESFIYDFPGVGNEFKEDGWGGHHELYAELFRYYQLGYEMPEEFKQFYDKEAIYKIWERYPNFWSRL